MLSAGQSWHELAPAAGLKRPAGHDWHERPATELKVPASQVKHRPATV